MRTNPKNPKNRPGFIRSRGFLFLLGIAILVAISYFGTNWGREYYILKMGQSCSERLWIIENAKEKYRKKTGRQTGKIDTYAELLAYLPFTGFPMCPWGGDYEDKLNLSAKTSCSCNGKPEYEPKVNPPGTNIMLNGYNDLGKKPDAVGLVDFLQAKVGKKPTGKENEKPEKKPNSLFK